MKIPFLKSLLIACGLLGFIYSGISLGLSPPTDPQTKEIKTKTNKTVALLPPYYQQTKEIQAVLEDKDVIDKIGNGRPIRSILQVSVDGMSGWRVIAGQHGECSLLVKVEYLTTNPPGFVGPAKFNLIPGDLVCQTPSPVTSMDNYDSGINPMLPQTEDRD